MARDSMPRQILDDIVSKHKDLCQGPNREARKKSNAPSVSPANDLKAQAMLNLKLEAYPTIDDFLAYLRIKRPERNYDKYRSLIVDGIEAQTVGELLHVIRQDSQRYPSPGIAFIELIKYELKKVKFYDVAEEPSQTAATMFVRSLEESVVEFEMNKSSN